MILEPILFILDLDNTIIGDISLNSIEWILINEINKEIKKTNNKKISYSKYKKNLENDLKTNLLRPYFIDFIKYIKQYENVELYIYTASDKKWAEFLIPIIENIIKYKFNRPIFNREHTQIFKYTKNNKDLNNNLIIKKSINNIKPILFSNLKKKYNNLQDALDLNKIFFVDNTKNILLEQEYFILCSSYNNYNKVDFIRNISKDILQKYYPIIEHLLLMKHSLNYETFYKRYYKSLNNYYIIKKKDYLKNTIKNNQYNDETINFNKYQLYIRKKDKYWYYFMLTLNKYLKNNKYNTCLNNLRNIINYS